MNRNKSIKGLTPQHLARVWDKVEEPIGMHTYTQHHNNPKNKNNH